MAKEKALQLLAMLILLACAAGPATRSQVSQGADREDDEEVTEDQRKSLSNIAAEYALEESHFAFLGTCETSRMGQGIAPFHDESERLGLTKTPWGTSGREHFVC